MSHLSWEYKITLLCVLLSAIFGLLLAAEWWYGRTYRSEIIDEIFKVNKANFEMQPIPEYPFSKFPVEHYSDFIERPVFFEGRKPIAKVAEANTAATEVAVKPPAEEFKLVLTGILNTPKGVRALFQDPTATVHADKYKRLQQGDIHAGWTVIDIQLDKVSIQADTETKEIPLLKSKPKNPTGAAAAPAAVPAGVPLGGPPISPPGNPPLGKPAINPFNLKH